MADSGLRTRSWSSGPRFGGMVCSRVGDLAARGESAGLSLGLTPGGAVGDCAAPRGGLVGLRRGASRFRRVGVVCAAGVCCGE